MERNAGPNSGGGSGGGCLGILGLVIILMPIAVYAGLYAVLGGLLLMLSVRLWNEEHRLGYGAAYKAAFWSAFWYQLISTAVVVTAALLLQHYPGTAPAVVQRVLFAQVELMFDPLAMMSAASAIFPGLADASALTDMLVFQHDAAWFKAMGLLIIPGLLIAAIALRKQLRSYFPPPMAYAKALLLTGIALLPAILITMRAIGWVFLQVMLHVQDLLIQRGGSL